LFAGTDGASQILLDELKFVGHKAERIARALERGDFTASFMSYDNGGISGLSFGFPNQKYSVQPRQKIARKMS
jgi:hypothetical protein